MPRLLLIDPEPLNFTGHHRSVDREIEASCRETGLEFQLFDHSHFTLRTYLSDAEIRQWLAEPGALNEDYSRLPIQAGDRILMHTASPWHLNALLERLRTTEAVQCAVGLIYPVNIWSKDPDLLSELSDWLERLLGQLAKLDVFAYSETGYLQLQESRIPLPSLVLPLSDATLKNIDALKQATPGSPEAPVRFAFFGQPRTEKGIHVVMSLLSRNRYPGAEFHFCLPKNHRDMECEFRELARLNSAIAHFDTFDHEKYFRMMAACDAVLCFYDPDYYGIQMSGIVTDAPLLGKATLITRGTEPANFLARYCPGAYVPVDYHADSLDEALSLPKESWNEICYKSEASGTLMRELKSARRFLRVTLSI